MLAKFGLRASQSRVFASALVPSLTLSLACFRFNALRASGKKAVERWTLAGWTVDGRMERLVAQGETETAVSGVAFRFDPTMVTKTRDLTPK